MEPSRQAQPITSPDLSSVLLELGEDPSINIITILEFGAQFLNCAHLNYIENGNEPDPELELEDSEAIQVPISGTTRTLKLYRPFDELNSDNLRIFTSLLIQQERRLRDILRMQSLKDYTKKLFEACPDGIVVSDESGAIINTNRAMVSMTRRPAESLIGLRVSNLTSREGRSLAFQAFRKLKQQSRTRFDCRMNVGAGRTIPVSICFSDFRFQEQSLILATVRDLSYLEEEVKKCTTYEQSMAQSIKNATDGFVRYDQFGRITEVNPHVEKLTGVYSTRLIGRPIDDLLTDESLRAFRQAVTRLNESGYASFNCAVNHADGAEIPARGTLMQFEVEGERYCRLMLQAQPKSAGYDQISEPAAAI